MKGVAVLCALLAGSASAHMQMMKPYPIRSPLNKDSKGEKDYSYTNPLQASGADYPCKGYAEDEFDSQATYQPGQSYEMELDGSATHDGGSCQLALTYDQGKTFKVIESMLGTCPTPKKYNFKVPSDAPNGEALLAWTWFNKVGNREMYMNCAMVTIGGSSGGNDTESINEHEHNKPAEHPKAEDKKASHPPMEMATRDVAHTEASFDSLPELFVANVKQKGDCVTVEGESVDFPEPGDNVIGKSDGKGYKCSGNAPFLKADDSSSSSDKDDSKSDDKEESKNNKDDKKNSVDDKDSKMDAAEKPHHADKNDKMEKENKHQKTEDDKEDASDDEKPQYTDKHEKTEKDSKHEKTEKDSKTEKEDKDSDKKESNKSVTRSTPQSMSKIAQAFGTSAVAAPRVLSTDASTNNQFSSYVGGWTCTSGEILCSPDGFTWAMCSNSVPIYMGSVAAGMVCRFGAMVAASW